MNIISLVVCLWWVATVMHVRFVLIARCKQLTKIVNYQSIKHDLYNLETYDTIIALCHHTSGCGETGYLKRYYDDDYE